MITQKEKTAKSIEDLSKISIVDKYFKSDGECVYIRKAFYIEFGPFKMEQDRHNKFSSLGPIDFLHPGYVGTYYYFGTIKEIISKAEDKIKKNLFSKFKVLLDKLTEEIENSNNKKVETEQLLIEKEKQIKDLEKKVEAMQKSNESSSTFKLLDSNEVAMEDYFSVDKNNQNFELVEDGFSSELTLKELRPIG